MSLEYEGFVSVLLFAVTPLQKPVGVDVVSDFPQDVLLMYKTQVYI